MTEKSKIEKAKNLFTLSPRDHGFLERVFSGGIEKYKSRLERINFNEQLDVLDAGCGYGQWSIAFSEHAKTVTGVDISSKRIEVARYLSEDLTTVNFSVAPLNFLPFKDNSFDCIFCYSAIYYADINKVLKEFKRVLKNKGLIYISTNSYGWYLMNLIKKPNNSIDFDPRKYALRTFYETFRYRFFSIPPSQRGSIVTSKKYMLKILAEHNYIILQCGHEGHLSFNPKFDKPNAFFQSKFLGLDCCIELVCENIK